jgi:hypothetical protein
MDAGADAQSPGGRDALTKSTPLIPDCAGMSGRQC